MTHETCRGTIRTEAGAVQNTILFLLLIRDDERDG